MPKGHPTKPRRPPVPDALLPLRQSSLPTDPAAEVVDDKLTCGRCRRCTWFTLTLFGDGSIGAVCVGCSNIAVQASAIPGRENEGIEEGRS
jgi:hypothetical protein